MKIDFYRATDRDLSTLANVQPRELLSNQDIIEKTSSEQKARDLSQTIIEAGRASFWMSTALDPECKGQSKGNPVYKTTVDGLEIYLIKDSGQLTLVDELTNAIGREQSLGNEKVFIPTKKPHLVLDGKTIVGSSVIGLLHAQSGDQGGTAEVSFFTKIPTKFTKTDGVGK